MSNGGYQRPIKKIPSEFAQAIIELIQWRDSTKFRRKAMAIQRVIDRKVMWAEEHDLRQSLYTYSANTLKLSDLARYTIEEIISLLLSFVIISFTIEPSNFTMSN